MAASRRGTPADEQWASGSKITRKLNALCTRPRLSTRTTRVRSSVQFTEDLAEPENRPGSHKEPSPALYPLATRPGGDMVASPDVLLKGQAAFR